MPLAMPAVKRALSPSATSPRGSSTLTFANGRLSYAACAAKESLPASSRGAPQAPLQNGLPTLLSGAPAGRPPRHARAEARRRRAPEAASFEDAGYLKMRSVTAKTDRLYRASVCLFEEFCRERKFYFDSISDRDTAFAAYFGHLFFNGHENHAARNCFWGYAYVYDEIVVGARYPKAHRALKGWNRAAPRRAGNPQPWELALAVSDLLSSNAAATTLGAAALTAARAVIFQFDTYARPSEALQLRRRDVIAPQQRKGTWSIILGPSDDCAEGSHPDMRRAFTGAPRAQGSKTGAFDNTVLIGEAASAAAGRGFLVDLLKAWVNHLKPNDKVFPITLAQYEGAIAWAHKELDVAHLRLHPHSLRHGGASLDALGGHRDMPTIQNRGQWGHANSVARYRKPGVYNRILNSLPAKIFARARLAESRLPRSLK